MLLIHKDGEMETLKDAAARIRAEGRLGTGAAVAPDGVRCAMGVIEDWGVTGSLWPLEYDSRIALINALNTSLAWANDRYEGTPEGRCEFIASWLESLP